MLETSAGDITVYLAPNLNITVRASIELANGHSIRSDFSEIRVTTEGGDWGPKTVTAEGKLNGGGPVLKVRTTTGDISFLGQPLELFSSSGRNEHAKIDSHAMLILPLSQRSQAEGSYVRKSPSARPSATPAKTSAAVPIWAWIRAMSPRTAWAL